ncbi:MAG: hypothetical protein ACRBBK_07755 [Paracoccaceae bacterium]
MKCHERQDHINEARDIAAGMQSLICEAPKEVVIEANALYALLNCIIERLDAASK